MPQGHKDTSYYLPIFSTKEAAEKYILWNKPQFSLNQIIQKLKDSAYNTTAENARTALEQILK